MGSIGRREISPELLPAARLASVRGNRYPRSMVDTMNHVAETCLKAAARRVPNGKSFFPLPCNVMINAGQKPVELSFENNLGIKNG